MVASPKYCSVEEAAQILGLSVSTIRRRIADGTLSVFQPGGERTAIRVPLVSLEHAVAVKPALIEHDPAELTTQPKRRGPSPKWQAMLEDPEQN